MLQLSPKVVLPAVAHDINWRLAHAAFRDVHPGVIIIEMDPWQEKVGLIELPDQVAMRLRPTTGTVLARGVDVHGILKPNSDASEVNPGDRVIIERYGGDWFKNAWFGAYDCKGQVRVFGDYSREFVHRIHPLKHVLGVMEANQIRAIHSKTLIRRDTCPSEEGGILLTERTQPRNQKATIVSMGSDALRMFPDLQVGDRVFYRGQAIVNEIDDLAREFNLPGDPVDYCFVDAENILAVLNEVVEEQVAA